jgi:hypothetical protein
VPIMSLYRLSFPILDPLRRRTLPLPTGYAASLESTAPRYSGGRGSRLKASRATHARAHEIPRGAQSRLDMDADGLEAGAASRAAGEESACAEQAPDAH